MRAESWKSTPAKLPTFLGPGRSLLAVLLPRALTVAIFPFQHPSPSLYCSPPLPDNIRLLLFYYTKKLSSLWTNVSVLSSSQSGVREETKEMDECEAFIITYSSIFWFLPQKSTKAFSSTNEPGTSEMTPA